MARHKRERVRSDRAVSPAPTRGAVAVGGGAARHRRQQVRSDRCVAGLLALSAVTTGAAGVVISHPGPAPAVVAIGPAQGQDVGQADGTASQAARAAVADYLAIRSTQAVLQASRSRHLGALQDELSVARSILADSAPDAAAVLAVAARYAGTPYRRGGDTPSGFDCSGYTRFVFAQVGVDLPRVAQAQFHRASVVGADEVRPGDLVFFHSRSGHVYHVGIYAGDGMVWHSPHPGKSVEEVRVFGRVTYGRVPSDAAGQRAAQRVAALTTAIAQAAST